MPPAEFALVLSLVTMGAVVAIGKRNVVDFAIFAFGSLGLSGFVFGVLERTQGYVPVPEAQLFVGLSFLILTVYILLKPRSGVSTLLSRKWMLPVSVVTVLALLIFARLQALTENPNLFSGAGRLAYAEDNARWVHFSSNIAQGNPLSLTEGVSGGVAALLIIAGAIAALFMGFSSEDANLPAQIIQTVFISHSLLLLLAPLSVSALVSSVWLGRLRSRSPVWLFRRNGWVNFGILLGLLVAILAVGATLAVGHLTLEFTILLLIFWMSFTVHLRGQGTHIVVVTIVGSSVSMAWLPMPYVGIAIAATGLVASLLHKKRLEPRRWWAQTITLVLNLVITAWLSLNFVAATATSSSSVGNELITAEGGTRSVELYEFILLLIVIATLFGVYLRIGRGQALAYLFRFYPVVILLGYASAVLVFDYLVSPEGWPHYGARKLSYGLVLVTIASVLPIASRLLSDKTPMLRILSVIALASFAAVLLTTSTARSGGAQLSANVWKAYDQAPGSATPQPRFWVQLANPHSGSQSLSDYPIACFQTDDAGELVSGSLNPHVCTRFLIGMHGIEPRAWNTMSAMIAGNEIAPEGFPELEFLDTEFGTKSVLRLAPDGTVKDTITLSQFIRRVNPDFSG